MIVSPRCTISFGANLSSITVDKGSGPEWLSSPKPKFCGSVNRATTNAATSASIPISQNAERYIRRESPVQSYCVVRYRRSAIMVSPGLASRGHVFEHSPQ